MAESNESESATDPEVASGLAAAVEAYEEALSKHGGSPCDRYILMAVHDSRVQQAIAKHIASGEFFIGAYCPTGPGIPEEARVVFEFRCLPPKICLLPNLFLVVLNAFTGRVLRLIDPYFPGAEQSPSAAESAAGASSLAQSDSAAHHPTLAAHHPTLATHHPSLAAHHPTLAMHHPSLAAHHPTLAAHHPSLAAHHPTLAAHHPSLAAHHPSVAAHHPILAAHHPSLGT